MTQLIEPQFMYLFVPASQPDPRITLLLLPGKGGNEQDLVPPGAELLPGAAQQYGLVKNKVVAVGYLNGANVAASLLLSHPHALAGAVLFRPMLPFTPDFEPNLGRTSVLLSGCMQDPIVRGYITKALATMLTSFGAETEVYWHSGGHELGQDDLDVAPQWLSRKSHTWQNRKRAASQHL